MFMKTIGPGILERYGFRKVLMYNALFAGIALAIYGCFTVGTPVGLMLAIVAIGGFFPSLQFTALNTIVYADIASEDAGRATSLASVVQQLSLGFGVIVAGMTLQLSHHLQGHEQIVAGDFWPAFVVIGLCSIASIPVTRMLPANAGRQLSQAA
ncbi:MAG: hypothetical protein JO218_10870 [Burkholderiales bacterium]|nr:hypothetical protein [Burkholderiales bacterium]